LARRQIYLYREAGKQGKTAAKTKGEEEAGQGEKVKALHGMRKGLE